ncbi:MAG: O-antigen ligase family protein [Planctomycetota bacterium]|jgi:O-antigen ligase
MSRTLPELPGTTAPPAIRWLAFATIAVSGVVRSEPAPTDLFFGLLLGFAVVLRVPRLKGMGAVTVLGLVVFVWANLVSLVVTPDAIGAFRYFVITVYMILIFGLIAGLIGRYGPRFLELCLNAYCMGAVGVGGLAVLARLGIIDATPFTDDSGLRLLGTFKDANVFAPYVAAGVLVALCQYLTGRRSLASGLTVSLVCFMATLFAFSRGAFGVLAAAMGFFSLCCLFVVRDKRISSKLVVSLSIGGVAAFLGIIYAVAFTDMASFMSQRLAMQSYDQHRFAMQAAAWHVAAAHPLGVGPGAWLTIHWQLPHNVYLLILAENGLTGCVGFVLWCVGCVWRGLGGMVRRTPNAPFYAMTIAVVIGLLLESLIIDTLHWRQLFLFLSFPVGLRIWEVRQGEAEAA